MKQVLVLLAISFCVLCILPFAEPKVTAYRDEDFWQWKKQNDKEIGNFTYWLMPMALYPRCACLRCTNSLHSCSSHASPLPRPDIPTAFLLSVRFGPPLDAKHQESRDDFIDSSPALVFWFQWVFVPWLPIKNTAMVYFRDAHTYLDDILIMVSWIGIALDVIITITVSSHAAIMCLT